MPDIRGSFNSDRFEEDCSPEAIFGTIVLEEVMDFVSILYATLVRFYLTSVQIEDLDQMSEDLIEIATSLTIDGALSNWLIKVCRLVLC